MSQIQALSVAGGRGRAACARVGEFAADFATALRRALPFLARRRVGVIAEAPRCVSFAELAADGAIVHVAPFNVTAVASKRGLAEAGPGGNARGLVLFDEMAVARILDGVLGGDGASLLPCAKLTSAQSALAARVSGSMLRAFGEVFASRYGLASESTSNKEIEPGSAVVITLSIEGGGSILIAVPLGVIRTDEPTEPERIDTAIAAAMTEVELDVVAELGKVRLPLEAIARLQVGDVVRLSLPLDERARVCAGGAVLFHGRPTASGELVGVAIERRAREGSDRVPG